MAASGRLDYIRLNDLSAKIKSNSATKAEKDEYMLMLYSNGSVTKQQYDDYSSNKSSEEIFNAAITIGGVILLVYLLSEIFGKADKK